MITHSQYSMNRRLPSRAFASLPLASCTKICYNDRTFIRERKRMGTYKTLEEAQEVIRPVPIEDDYVEACSEKAQSDE